MACRYRRMLPFDDEELPISAGVDQSTPGAGESSRSARPIPRRVTTHPHHKQRESDAPSPLPSMTSP